jgi:hypothetical protein
MKVSFIKSVIGIILVIAVLLVIAEDKTEVTQESMSLNPEYKLSYSVYKVLYQAEDIVKELSSIVKDKYDMITEKEAPIQ